MAGLLQIPLCQDEVLTSYVSRLARANGRDRSSTFCCDLGLDFSRLSMADEAEVNRLTEIVGKPADMLRQATVRYEEKTVRYRGHTIRLAAAYKNTFRYCPRCFHDDELSEDRIPGTRRYRRAIWMFKAVQACPDHGCRLESLPGNFDSKGVRDFNAILDDQSAALDRQYVNVVDRLPVPLEYFIKDRLAGVTRHGVLLDQLPFGIALDLCDIFGVASMFGKEQRAASLSTEDLAAACNQGFAVLSAGDAGLRELLDRLGTLGPSARAGGRVLYGRLYETLKDRRPEPEYLPIKSFIREHAIATVPFVPGDEIFGPVQETQWLTPLQAAKAIGISGPKMTDLLRELGEIQPGAPARAVARVHRNTVNRMRKQIGEPIRSAAASEILGCEIPFVPRLAEAGLIERAQVVGLTSKSREALFRKASVERLRDRLWKAVTCQTADGLLSVRLAASATYLTKAEIVSRVAKGSLAKVALKASGFLEDRLLVDPAEFAAPQLPDEVTLDDVKAFLGVSRDTITLLRELGVLLPHVGRSSNKPKLVIPLGQLKTFDQKYISLGRLCSELKTRPQSLTPRLTALGISTAFPTRKNCALIFTRQDADRLRTDWTMPSAKREIAGPEDLPTYLG